jgi:hypothetical protein
MIPNERLSPFTRFFRKFKPKPVVRRATLASREVKIERKTFYFLLKENERGRYLCISEVAGGHHNTIVIPANGLEEFTKLVEGLTADAPTTNPDGVGASQQPNY